MPLVSHKKTVVSVIHRLVDYNDVDLDKRVWVREPEDPGIRGLQSTVQGAVTRLSEDLYSGEAGYRKKIPTEPSLLVSFKPGSQVILMAMF